MGKSRARIFLARGRKSLKTESGDDDEAGSVAKAETHPDQADEIEVGKGLVGRAGLTSLTLQCLPHHQCSSECMELDLMCDKL